MSQTNRPLSPHLQVYRPQITTVLSILHRITGFGLVIGLLPFIWWLLAAASCEDCYISVQKTFSSAWGQFFLLGWGWSLFYHMCNGIRHLFWDAGLGFEMKTARLSGWAAVLGATILTALAWFIPL